MDHGDHSSHGGHSMPMPMPNDGPSCSMNMLWNSQVEDVCVVFSSWHISGIFSMVLSCLIIILISIFYAYLIHTLRDFDRNIAIQLSSPTSSSRREGSMSASGGGGVGSARGSLIPPLQNGYSAVSTENGLGRLGVLQIRLVRATLYAITVALSFWLMLVAMTYNTFLFFSIVIGSFTGHLLYEGEIDVGLLAGDKKGLACH